MIHFSHSDVPVDARTMVIDLETTTQQNGKLMPWDGMSIYMTGILTDNAVWTGNKDEPTNWTADINLIVGHNLRFDLHFLRWYSTHVKILETPVWDYITSGKACVMDTQFLTYLASGQKMQYPSLEEACVYWGVPMKKSLDLSEELPKVGWDIAAIPNMREYLTNDLLMTAALWNKISTSEWFISNQKWLLKMHDGYLATFDMEHNGMHINPTRLVDLKNTTEKSLAFSETALKSYLVNCLSEKSTWLEGDDIDNVVDNFNFGSLKDVATIIFGGVFEWTKRVKVGNYASGKKIGQPRYKIEKKAVAITPWLSPTLRHVTDKGSTRVDDEALSIYMSHCDPLSPMMALLSTLRKHRELLKLQGTYLVGLAEHIKLHDKGYYVHPQINVTATATGRTSSSKPNMQNNPTHDDIGVASIYTSRFGDQGVLLEVDFKQIEVIALAIVSGDAQLKDDIKMGRDIHEMTGKSVFSHGMSKEERRIVKTINFGLIYGGSADTLASQAGIDVKLADELIQAFYKRYPVTKAYFNDYRATVTDLMTAVSKKFDDHGRQMYEAFAPSPTGRIYHYWSKWSAYRSEMTAPYTQTRNYPIQGLATGDLMFTAMADVFRRILPRFNGDVKLVGLVHDSLRFDLKVDKLEPTMVLLKYVLEKAGESLNAVSRSAFWDLPIKVTFSTGPNFHELKEI